MSRKALHFVILVALVAASSLALADPPARVGRVSAVEGQVSLRTDGDEDTGPLLNWPVTSSNHLTTARGGRAEFRVGSAAVRLDGDTDLEVVELDDDSLRLRLNYGSASIRLRAPEMVGDFELSTPQARIVLTEPGMLRVDTDRAPDTTTVSVFAGVARVDGAGTLLTVRAGKRADVRGEDVSTGLARADQFDEWAQSRDKRDEAAIATRYIPYDVTGYEELDQYGSWTENAEYGPLWTPRVLASDWAPYRDGRWAWIDPWGWTWVDNAPWGYAPSHYGRWVVVNRRWHWAPGRFAGRPVWAPALVGWVGGANWSVTFGSRHNGPGVGWYPLTPRDRFVPPYRISHDHERRLGWTYRGNELRWKDRDHDGRRDGVTVMPQDRFDRRNTVRVDRNQRVAIAPNAVRNAPLSTAPVPAGQPQRPNSLDRNRDGIPDRAQRDRNGDGVPDRQVISTRDRNGDGVPDRNFTNPRDRNGDGVPDRQVISTRDRNGDGVPDRQPVTAHDRNGDGQPDRPLVTPLPNGNPGRVMAVPPSRDLNNDGIRDRQLHTRPNPRDINGDGIADRTPFDRNGDGIRDGNERQPRPLAPRPQPQANPAPIMQSPPVVQQAQPQARPADDNRAERRQQMFEERRQRMEERNQGAENRSVQRPQPVQHAQPQPQPQPIPQQAAPAAQEQRPAGQQRPERRNPREKDQN
jgi:hypothetical protein